MSSTPCLRCLARPCVAFSRLGDRTNIVQALPLLASFSTTPELAKLPVKVKKGPAQTQRKGHGVSFRLKSKKRGALASSKSNTPAFGERKALRKRIVLSNTSALEVADLKEMDKESIRDESCIGTVMSLPGPIVDRLRAAQAFRKPQSWPLFRKPSTLIRKETVELAKEMGSIDKETLRRILVGNRGAGKSVLLLQAIAMAFQNEWIVVSIPEGHTIVNGSSNYQPVPNTSPVIYEQGQYAMQTLNRLTATNPSFRNLKVELQHQLPTTLPAKSSLFDLCELAAEDVEAAAPVLAALLRELSVPGRPPLLIAVDGLGYLMQNSAYKSASMEPIHAHDLAIVDWFMSHLSGKKSLPNGGLIIGATSESNDPKSETLSFRLRQLEIKQTLESGLQSSDAKSGFSDPTLPFLLATGQQPNPVPQPDPYYKYDERLFKVLGSPFGVVAGNQTASKKEVKIQALKGMTKEEARGIMEYWAKSGMLRQEVNDRLVGEKWTTSGGGVVGELERGCIRAC